MKWHVLVHKAVGSIRYWSALVSFVSKLLVKTAVSVIIRHFDEHYTKWEGTFEKALMQEN